jgi:probable addiction module antidote protein
MTFKTRRWDSAEHLADHETEHVFLEAALKDGTPAEIALAIEAVGKARGMRAMAAELGVSPNRLFDLVNPYDDAFDLPALQKMADKLMAQSSAEPADAAE